MRRVSLATIALALVGTSGYAHSAPKKAIVSIQAPPDSPHACRSEHGLPDPVCTPGVARTTNVDDICHGGGTKQYRPSSSYTRSLKRQQLIAYEYADTNPADYEEDHLIPLEIGGSGSDPRNLWPEPREGKDNSLEKDKVENWLHHQICSGAVTPPEAQEGIRTNWRQYLPRMKGVATKR
jgi:hypothetical protein